MKTRKYAIYVIAILTLLVAVDFLVDRLIEGDPDLPRVRDYVQSSSQVLAKFGDVNEIQIKKITEVGMSPTTPPYKLYALYVSGEKEAGLIEVKAILKPGTMELDKIQLGR